MSHMTTAQVARAQGVSIRTVHRMVQAGELAPESKLPGHTGAYLFHPSEVSRAFARRPVKEAA